MKRREWLGVRVALVDSCHVDSRADERRVWVEDRDGFRVHKLYVRPSGFGEWVEPIELLSRAVDRAVA